MFKTNKNTVENYDGWFRRTNTQGWHLYAHVPAWTCIPPSWEKVLQISFREPTLTSCSSPLFMCLHGTCHT